MPIVEHVEYDLGTDKEFDLIARGRISKEAKDLSAFVGQTGDAIKLLVPGEANDVTTCLLYTSPSPRDQRGSRMPSSA